jgi:hypothetical protein
MNNQIIEDSIKKIFNNETNNYIFIYTPPKVGSTTLVTSLRISLGQTYSIIHIHDEVMLSVLTGINSVKINDIIHFLSNQGKNVYVIDVYRTSIERKMSEYFEKLSPYHFNNSEENISKYSLKRISDRFNKVIPNIEFNDHYFDKYGIIEQDIVPFDFINKFTIQTINRVKYIKLRLCDSELWASILSRIFNSDIVIIHDYKTEDKGIGELYKRFKNEYMLPINYYNQMKNDKYLNFYYNELERNKYLEQWLPKLSMVEAMPYSEDEFKFYINLCLENQYINDVQIDHYIDNGCFCEYCSKKRREIYFAAKAGVKNFNKINHNEIINKVKFEKMKEKVNEKMKVLNKRQIRNNKYAPKQFGINLSNK